MTTWSMAAGFTVRAEDMARAQEVVTVKLDRGKSGPTYDRDSSMNMALAQIGWLGFSGRVYPIGDGPTSAQEPGGFSPLLIQVGTWEDLGDGAWGIRD